MVTKRKQIVAQEEALTPFKPKVNKTKASSAPSRKNVFVRLNQVSPSKRRKKFQVDLSKPASLVPTKADKQADDMYSKAMKHYSTLDSLREASIQRIHAQSNTPLISSKSHSLVKSFWAKKLRGAVEDRDEVPAMEMRKSSWTWASSPISLMMIASRMS